MVQYTLLLKPYKPLLPFECEKVYPKRWIRTRNWSGRDCSSKSSESSFLPSDLPPTIETARPFFLLLIHRAKNFELSGLRSCWLLLLSIEQGWTHFPWHPPQRMRKVFALTHQPFFPGSMHQNQCCSSCQLKLGRKNLLFSRLPVCQLLGGEFIIRA